MGRRDLNVFSTNEIAAPEKEEEYVRHLGIHCCPVLIHILLLGEDSLKLYSRLHGRSEPGRRLIV